MAERYEKLIVKEGIGVVIDRERRGSEENLLEQTAKRKGDRMEATKEDERGEREDGGEKFAFKKGRRLGITTEGGRTEWEYRMMEE
ncbi:hypothetical protein EAI_10401 [Harpegnathos saltator]|uniref:Uncharacterized protein n=1 Tax=Harpegnathos saltator TaxID=610380 RepID=E2C8U5_HARSA|nr:hypothetical protein EAI_10401 [Harpegnathos saltator]